MYGHMEGWFEVASGAGREDERVAVARSGWLKVVEDGVGVGGALWFTRMRYFGFH